MSLYVTELNVLFQQVMHVNQITAYLSLSSLEYSRKRELPTEDMTREYREALQSVYITKTEALELLHVQLGHLPYHRIERMLQLGVISGPKLDKQLLKQLI